MLQTLAFCIEQLIDTARKTCAQLAHIVILVDVLHASGHGLLEALLRLCQAVAFADWMRLHEMQMIGWEHDNGRVGTSKWRVESLKT